MSHNHYEISNENEKKCLIVLCFTFCIMVVEIVFGYMTGSMGLLADGYHMCTHLFAIGLTYVAYILSRKLSPLHFPNGTGKIGLLSGYTSSLFLGLTGIWIIIEAIIRFLNPVDIQFNDAILVAIIGLFVNLVCILIMGNKKHTKDDYNFKAAYYHILADILTSLLAISALIIGKYFNITYLDVTVGILGGILIIKWSWMLLKDTVKKLIDFS